MYRLLRSHARRSIGSRIYGNALNSCQNGSVERLRTPVLRSQLHAPCHVLRQASTNAAQLREVTGDEDVQNGFDLLRVFEEEGESLSDETQRPVTRPFEELQIWEEPLDAPKTAGEVFLDYWKTPETAKPTDLSYWNVLQGEIEGRFPKAAIAQSHAFRVESNHAPDRSLTLLFIFEYYDKIWSSQGLSDEVLSTLLSAVKIERPSESIGRLVDIMHYSWVLLAEPSNVVRRFISLANYREKENLRQLPKWLLLQALRTQSIDRESLMELIEWLSTDRLELWKWSGSSAMILGVRLVRHMRRVPAPDFEAVTAIFIAVLRLRFEEGLHSELSTVTHWCNRFLSLLAVPAEGRPFKAVTSQQSAQLDLLQFMQDFWQEIHLGREGYRALARLQVMHGKTASERQWAEAKALTWPPWEERNRMGAVLVPSHYEGKETRTLKVLNRMVESGYAPHRAEANMKILAGWDTDKSPTIQASRTLPPIRRPWEAGPELDEALADHQIWSSRIEATRSVREAWMVFCTYLNSSHPKTRPQYVYFAMHKKLMAPKAGPNSPLLPGDGPEVFADPELARDQVYIPQKIPAVSELVSRMLENRIQCNANLLRYFLDKEILLNTGLALIENSSLNSDMRDILSNPHCSSVADVVEVLKTRDGAQLREAFLKLLTRPNTPKAEPLRHFEVLADSNGPEFARQCLLQLRSRDARPWEAYFTGLAAHLSADSEGYHRIYHKKVLMLMDRMLDYIARNTTPTVSIVRTVLRTALAHDLPMARVKEVFVAGVHGPLTKNSELDFLSFCKGWKGKFRKDSLSADTIEDMVWALGSQASPTSRDEILALLKMIHDRKFQLFKSGVRLSQHNLATFRLFLEQDWLRRGFGTIHNWEPLDRHMAEYADFMIHDFAYTHSSDEYMLKYLDFTTHRRHRVQMKILMAKSEAPLRDRHVDISDGSKTYQSTIKVP